MAEKIRVELYEVPVNNHGCIGFGVSIETSDPTTGVVVDGYSCSSCWQVGHDKNESPIPIGTVVRLDPTVVKTWKLASVEIGQSHNELIHDSVEDPQSDSTFITPSALAKMQRDLNKLV